MGNAPSSEFSDSELGKWCDSYADSYNQSARIQQITDDITRLQVQIKELEETTKTHQERAKETFRNIASGFGVDATEYVENIQQRLSSNDLRTCQSLKEEFEKKAANITTTAGKEANEPQLEPGE